MSLPLASIVLAVAAALLFRAATAMQHDVLSEALAERRANAAAVALERAKLSDALIKDRADLAAERRNRLAETEARVKALEAQIADLNAKWLQLVQEKARAKPVPDARPKRRK